MPGGVGGGEAVRHFPIPISDKVAISIYNTIVIVSHLSETSSFAKVLGLNRATAFLISCAILEGLSPIFMLL